MPRTCQDAVDDDGDDKLVTIHVELLLLLGRTPFVQTCAQKVQAAIRFHTAIADIADVAIAAVECERLGFSRLDSQLPLS